MQRSGLARLRLVAGAAMIATPLVAVLAEVLHPRFHPTDAAQQVAAVAAGTGRHYVAHVLVLLVLALAVPAFVGLVYLARGRRRLAVAALAVFVPGLIALAAIVGTELVLWQMAQPGADRAEMVALVERMNESAGILAVFAVALLFPLAWLLAGVGLLVTRAIPVWSAVLVGLALPLAFAIELGGGAKAATVGANVAFAIGLVPVGVRVLRQSDEQRAQAPSASTATPAAP